MVAAMAPQLTPEDWIAAGFRALASGGLAAIRAEAIARDLGVSKGSFYWHFKDVPTFREVMLTHWEDQATDRILAMVEAGAPDPGGRLQLLADLATSDLDGPYGGFHTEAAIRAWARSDPVAAAVQTQVDRRRLAYLAACFDEAGLPDAMLRARLSLAALVGAQHLAPTEPASQRAQLRLLLALLLLPQPITEEAARPRIA